MSDSHLCILYQDILDFVNVAYHSKSKFKRNTLGSFFSLLIQQFRFNCTSVPLLFHIILTKTKPIYIIV